MPPKSKATPKAKDSSGSSKTATTPPVAEAPRTVNERSIERFYQTRPYAYSLERVGVSGLSPADRTAWTSAQLLGSASATSLSRGGRHNLPNKSQKELWRHINESSLPLRTLRRPPAPTPATPPQGPVASPRPSAGPAALWGRDRSGRYVGDYPFEEFRARTEKRLRLTTLEVARHAFEAKREAGETTADDIEEERQRRVDIAKLRMELYGQHIGGSYAQDPNWDDVEPIVLDEPEGALAAIAYPEAYAEAIAYLRAVMTKPEYSARCLKLTEHVISLNPAHYTVWLYRFSIVKALQLPIEAETEWLNTVALQNLKNYQIWHHRYLLAECYYPQIASEPERVTAFAKSEMAFLTTILAEDTKNYHVWSYRQYLVRKLGYWTDDERYSTESFISQDVRNNSAWSHRFFVVFSDPKQSSAVAAGENQEKNAETGLEAGMAALEVNHDPAVPVAIVDREIEYAEKNILKAPQNESPWNYLRGVLAKGGRPLASVEAFAAQFVSGIGGDDEAVKSTHAMDLLASIFAEKGDKAQAHVYLEQLAQKWDPIRVGYWRYRQQELA